MVSRSVCWRAGRSSGPPRSSCKRAPGAAVSRARIACGGSNLLRAAASSIARGNPSRWTQIAATAAAFSVSRWKVGMTAWARCIKSVTAEIWASVTTSGSCFRSGKANGATGYSCSPEMCKMARLATSMVRREQVTSSFASWGAAAATCSTLSRKRSRSLSRR